MASNNTVEPIEVLRDYLDRGLTGELKILGQRHDYVYVYIMSWEVVAARSSAFGVEMLQRLMKMGLVSDEAIASFSGSDNEVYSLVDDAMAIRLAEERFKEDLCRFIEGSGPISFKELDSVIVDNMQMGHDSHALLDSLVELLSSLKPYFKEQRLKATETGRSEQLSDEKKILLALVGEASLLRPLVKQSPFEFHHTLNLVKELVDSNVLEIDNTFQLQDGVLRRGGEFSLAEELLDYVDLSEILPPTNVEEESIIIEMAEGDAAAEAEGVKLTFSGPTLSAKEASQKLAVGNEVLRQVAATLDNTFEAGAGQAAIQLLLESTPSNYSFLFNGLETKPDGTFEIVKALKNLDYKPVSEQRRALNSATQDLIERALTMAFEQLPEDSVDAMLASIAGYQEKLGL